VQVTPVHCIFSWKNPTKFLAKRSTIKKLINLGLLQEFDFGSNTAFEKIITFSYG